MRSLTWLMLLVGLLASSSAPGARADDAAEIPPVTFAAPPTIAVGRFGARGIPRRFPQADPQALMTRAVRDALRDSRRWRVVDEPTAQPAGPPPRYLLTGEITGLSCGIKSEEVQDAQSEGESSWPRSTTNYWGTAAVTVKVTVRDLDGRQPWTPFEVLGTADADFGSVLLPEEEKRLPALVGDAFARVASALARRFVPPIAGRVVEKRVSGKDRWVVLDIGPARGLDDAVEVRFFHRGDGAGPGAAVRTGKDPCVGRVDARLPRDIDRDARGVVPVGCWVNKGFPFNTRWRLVPSDAAFEAVAVGDWAVLFPPSH